MPSSVEFEDFWDYGNALRFSLSFSSASLYALSHYGSTDSQKWGDVYFPATMVVSVDGLSQTLDEVGVRMKGNTSRNQFVDSDGTITGLCHFKISFEETFDDLTYYGLSQFSPFRHVWPTGAGDATREERENRTFAGMKKINLKYLPRNTDSVTYSQEIYCYDAFAEAGLLAPKSKWGQLSISNGHSSTVSSHYELVENIDKTFLKRHYAKAAAQGDLYKCVYSKKGKADFTRSETVKESYDGDGYANGSAIEYGKIGCEDNYAGYHPSYQLNTNDDAMQKSDFSKLSALINGLWSCRYKGAPASLLESLIDVDEFLRYEAVSVLLGNPDDQRNNYNNFYLYFVPSTGKAVYIPYDWDWSLGATWGPNFSSTGLFNDRDCGGETQSANIYWDTLLSGSSSSPAYSLEDYRKRYSDYAKDLIGKGVLDYDEYVSFVSSLSNAVFNEGSSVSAFMSTKKSAIMGSYLS